MSVKRKFFAGLTVTLFVAAMFAPGDIAEAAKARLAFSGGPDGGTFQYFSNAISSRLSRTEADMDVSNMASAGSVENLRRVNSGDADFGLVYSGDIYLAMHGQLTNDPREYKNVYGMAYLFGAPAHLIALDGRGINSVEDLAGKRVAVGPAGSGAAASAQRYFTALGLWDKFTPEFIGYSQGASALGDRLIDAMWVFAGFPNSSIIQAAASNRIVILDLVEAGQKAGFFDKNPYYTEVTIPAGTYQGVDKDTATFQDSTIWVAGKHVKDDHVYRALKNIYSDEGLAFMVSVTTTARAMSVEDGLRGIVTPVHKGAENFWTEKGLTLTEAQQIK
ncbi:TAXI family TRAP transporter solute-binding subunit [Geoalkalibacter halelectricus]|uniref:TAXI family TRAP transporter solute-binding subunit n=1 Tax=Geoalkalibacter halelectricus TaxID=2847045 RepID=A0ABY5ZLC1_9BACT|nr:TAXI family TRAP transporter solute-binding subunit [Geoalkalibacter halelectricus]MDO3377050.1 TAXI family TRAP transporter solute-binding subunit [Geoalkalibacter halelectricus]UWZ79496.1 TAXI family TRAP transporter solute-binding subunit [Geoalkalibacter halelectricus]